MGLTAYDQNRCETMQKNITLAPELFDELSEQARVEGKTTDELVEEAARKLLQTRRDVGRLRSFVSDNRREAAARGLKPSDVPARIAEYRSGIKYHEGGGVL